MTDRKKEAVTDRDEEVLLQRFPSENPNPVFGIGSDGMVLYANDAAKPILEKFSSGVIKQIPDSWKDKLENRRRIEELAGKLCKSKL